MKNVAKFAVIMSIFTMSLLFSGLAFAAVPDKLDCDAEPIAIHATWDQNNPSKTDVTVQLLTDDNYPVKMCGVEIKCESQNTDVLAGEFGDAIVVGTTDEFGRVDLEFFSTGDRKANVKSVNIICRSSIVKGLDGSDLVEAYTDSLGVAYAQFVSSGSGSENEGTTNVMVEVDGGYGIGYQNIPVWTTRNYGTTNINGQLYVSTFPKAILADDSSTVQACVQLRKTDGHIIRDAPLKMISFVSHSTSKLLPVVQADPNNPGYTATESEDSSFPQGGVYTTYFKSAGIYDPNSVGNARIEASTEFFANDDAQVTLIGAQYWPNSIRVTSSPARILCDGESKVKMTAQLVDKSNYPVLCLEDQLCSNPTYQDFLLIPLMAIQS